LETIWMIGTAPADSAVAMMCWEDGGKRLVGLMIVRRSGGHACVVDMPPALARRLVTFDSKYVEEHVAEFLAIAYEGLVEVSFAQDRVTSRDFLQHGYRLAVPGTIRYIPAEPAANDPSGIATWRTASFIVDVGEVNLQRVRRQTTLHRVTGHWVRRCGPR
jgi:hypothetical protein